MNKIGFALLLLVAACGGGGSDTPDARPTFDAAPPSVTMVDCGANAPNATVTTSGNAYSPATTNITAGQVVRFSPTATHDVASTTAGQPFSVGLGGDACFRFASAGTFTFRCNPHGFTGSIVVQ